uniref:valine--tRNA ligase n=1 Tax=Dermatophagoides pteronyssinus TaxID=6956 RepID=A0A6P6YJE5_DERPT
MIMPPPNVTGYLHLGHTMMVAVEDTLVRFERMRGRNVCWVPGTDHAGIATQSVVERQLLKQGVSRHDLGREEFLRRVWQWKEEKGDRILFQLKRLGASCDWSREAFTMSPQLSAAVQAAFITLFERRLIYRAERLVSWSPHLNTALSDIEVDVFEVEKPGTMRVPGFDKPVEVGWLWVFKYQVCDSEEAIEVATSRPETMFGDTAVAVNPRDARFQHLIGKRLVHPFVPAREVRVIADEHCDPEYGTGAVKITPAHDKNDFALGQRHGLPLVNVFTDDGYMNEEAGAFAGLHRFVARVEVLKQLEQRGLFVGKVKNPRKMAIPICSRSGDVVEYMMKPQWYVDCQRMAARAVDAVRSGALQLFPENYTKQWDYWLGNIQDWCISRQLWWGHRIPAYRVLSADVARAPTAADERWVVAASAEEALARAQREFGADVRVEQDEDVLDTWFSSGLFPFSVFGWPAQTPALAKFFPTDVLETGVDILFFWVARMVMLSLELTDALPFTRVVLHPLVRDSHGRKMSKSLGNIIDPLDVIEGVSLETLQAGLRSGNLKESELKRALDAQQKEFPTGISECGADALRFALLSYLRAGKDINLDVNRVVAYRHFCNKLWNAAKFAVG